MQTLHPNSPTPLASPVPPLHLPNPTPPRPRPLNQLLPSPHTLPHSLMLSHAHTHSRVRSLLHAHTHPLASLSFLHSHAHTLSLSHTLNRFFFSIGSATFQRLREIFTLGRCFVHKHTHKPGQISVRYPQRCADSGFIGDHKHTNTLVHSLTQ